MTLRGTSVTATCCSHGAINPLSTKLNPICHFLALLGVYLILHVNRVRVKVLKDQTMSLVKIT